MFARLSTLAIATTLASALAGPTQASPADDLLDLLGIGDIIEVMRDEGLDYGQELARDMLPGGTSATWSSQVSDIYDTQEMYDLVSARFEESLGDQDLDPLMAYFGSDAGQRVVELELEARREMIDSAVEEAARASFRAIEGSDDPRLAQLEEMVAANDLIEANVAGAMNASYNFYTGLVEGGAFEMSEGDIVADVWAQEEETREDTREWLYGYLLMAYEPLEDAALDDYIDLSASEAGRAMNRALFAGFNEMYDVISRELGQAAAEQMQGQEL